MISLKAVSAVPSWNVVLLGSCHAHILRYLRKKPTFGEVNDTSLLMEEWAGTLGEIQSRTNNACNWLGLGSNMHLCVLGHTEEV